MPRAFDTAAGKGFPRALKNLRSFLSGGQVHDFEFVTLTGAGPTAFTPLEGQAYELRVRTTGGAVAHDLDLSLSAVGMIKLGQRLKILYESEVTGGASLTVTEGANVAIVSLGMQGETPVGATTMTFAAPGDRLLLEYAGRVSGTTDTWNILYAVGATVA